MKKSVKNALDSRQDSFKCTYTEIESIIFTCWNTVSNLTSLVSAELFVSMINNVAELTTNDMEPMT